MYSFAYGWHKSHLAGKFFCSVDQMFVGQMVLDQKEWNFKKYSNVEILEFQDFLLLVRDIYWSKL